MKKLTVAQAEYVSDGTAFFNEALMTAILMFVILAVTDRKSQGSALPAYLVGLALFCTMLGIALCLGTTTGFAMNPARDFGPRLLTLMVGYGKGVFTYRKYVMLLCTSTRKFAYGHVQPLLALVRLARPDHRRAHCCVLVRPAPVHGRRWHLQSQADPAQKWALWLPGQD